MSIFPTKSPLSIVLFGGGAEKIRFSVDSFVEKLSFSVNYRAVSIWIIFGIFVDFR